MQYYSLLIASFHGPTPKIQALPPFGLVVVMHGVEIIGVWHQAVCWIIPQLKRILRIVLKGKRVKEVVYYDLSLRIRRMP